MARHRMTYKRNSALFNKRMRYSKFGVTWEDTPCCYCGDPATAQDHVFPVAAYTKLFKAERLHVPMEVLRRVPACKECNSLASDAVFYSFEEKRLHIKAQLAKRYRQLLSMPPWSADELAELKGGLHTWVIASQENYDRLLERLRY